MISYSKEVVIVTQTFQFHAFQWILLVIKNKSSENCFCWWENIYIYIAVESPDSESAGGNVAKPSCKSFHREGTPEEKPKGILKSPNLGSRDSFGFNEQFDLNESNVMYGSMLRRKYVSLNQDNRLCLRFGFQPNLGCVYESSVSANREVAHVKKNNDPKSNSLLFPGHSVMMPEPVARGAIPHLSQGAVPKSAKSVHDVSNPQASQAPVRKTSGKVEADQSAMSHGMLTPQKFIPLSYHISHSVDMFYIVWELLFSIYKHWHNVSDGCTGKSIAIHCFFNIIQYNYRIR